MSIYIIGAGIAGLIAARILRKHDPVILEASKSLPNNHSALLRFRSPVVGDATGIPFKKVRVVKSSDRWLNPAADSLAYAKKCGGEYRSDRSIVQGEEVAERYIAPPDFIQQLADDVEIVYGHKFGFTKPDRDVFGKVISTIPMPHLMAALAYPHALKASIFRYQDGLNLLATIENCDAYASVYIPHPSSPFSRVSITGDKLIAEIPNKNRFLTNVIGNATMEDVAERGPEIWDNIHDQAENAAKVLGIEAEDIDMGSIDLRDQAYSKILPIDEGERRRFIYWASTEQGMAFSLGRFSTWRPGLLADDLPKDIRIIESLMTSTSSGYDAQKIERDRS